MHALIVKTLFWQLQQVWKLYYIKSESQTTKWFFPHIFAGYGVPQYPPPNNYIIPTSFQIFRASFFHLSKDGVHIF